MDIPAYGPYRKDYYQGKPWHLKPFMEDERVSYPYDHESAVLYTGVNKHIFFKEGAEGRPEESRNPKSVLNQRVLKQGNFMAGGKSKRGIHSEGIFFGFLQVAAFYATRHTDKSGVGGAVLEIQVPVERLTTIISPYPNGFRDREEISSEFDSPETFREKCLKHKGSEGLHWSYRNPIPVDNITGVWDVENSDGLNFLPKEEFLTNLRSQYGDRVPRNSKYSEFDKQKAIEEIIKEINEYKEISNQISELQEKFESIILWIRKMHVKGSSEVSVQTLIKNYNTEREKLEIILKDDFGIEVSRKPETTINQLQKNAGNIEERILNAKSGVKKTIQEEQEHAQENNWNKEKFNKERIFESNLEDKIGEKILNIPYIDNN